MSTAIMFVYYRFDFRYFRDMHVCFYVLLSTAAGVNPYILFCKLARFPTHKLVKSQEHGGGIFVNS